MKNIKILLLTISLLCFSSTVNAKTSTEIINDINTSSGYVVDVANLFIGWSNNHASNLKDIITPTFLGGLNDTPYDNVNVISNALSGSAKTDFDLIKSDLAFKIRFIKDTMDETYVYLDSNRDELTIGENGKIFRAIKVMMTNCKDKVKGVFDIYYNLYHDELLSISDSYSFDDMLVYYENKMDNINMLLSIINKRIVDWQDVYNYFDLDDYDADDYITYYVSSFRADYDFMYNKLEVKAQNLLDSKINAIVDDTNLQDADSILNRNNKLLDLMDKLSNMKNRISAKYNILNSRILMVKYKTDILNKETNVSNRFDTAIMYVKSFILDLDVLKIKDKSDEEIIDIDSTRGIIIYDSYELESSKFINKLSSDYSNIVALKKYDSNIGTFSEINVDYHNTIVGEYLIIVRGDVHADGKISALDYVSIKNHIMSSDVIENEYIKIAADANADNKISALDYVKVKNYIMSKGV